MRYVRYLALLTMLCAIVVGASSCNDAAAKALDLTLAVEYQGDTARVIARWTPRGDSKGMPTAHRVAWMRGNTSSPPVVKSNTYSMPRAVDTLWTIRPAVGDSVRITFGLRAVRRDTVSQQVTVSTWLRNPDAPPPPPDSVRIDTLAMQDAAFLDSFPVIVVRDARSGLAAERMLTGERRQTCALARNRYTGAVHIIGAGDLPDSLVSSYAQACDSAAVLYAAERSG